LPHEREVRRLLWILPLVFLIAWGQPVNDRTGGSLNGRWWLKMTRAGKISYLEGYIEGFSTGLIMFTDMSKASTREHEFYPFKLNFGEVAEVLDSAYEQPENRPIPVWEILVVASMKAEGRPAQT
jgi:hypothetical protein